MQEFDDWMKKVLSDPIVAALGKVFVAREAAQHQQFEEKVRSITIERNMLHYQLQEKIKEADRDIRTINKSDETIATLTDENQKLKITLAVVQKFLRELAQRCSKASQKDLVDLQMQGLCILTQETLFAPTDKPRARSRSPRRRSEDVD